MRCALVFAWLSVSWAGFDTLHGTMRFWMLTHLSVAQYLIWTRLIGWPITGTLLAISGYFIWRAAHRPSFRQVFRSRRPLTELAA